MRFDAITRREFLALTGLSMAALSIPSSITNAAAGSGGESTWSNPYRPYTLSPYDKGMVIEDAWPTVFFGDEAVNEIKRKVAKLDWAKRAIKHIAAEADVVMQAPPQLPVEAAGWRHDFYSRITGEHLLYDPASPDKFLDPLTGVYEYDDAQRRAWALLTHERTYRLMRSLGVLYNVTGDRKYANWVADGMRQTVEYFKHDEFARGEAISALYYQPLYDAAVLMILANIYGLTKHSPAYSKQDAENIRTGIFEKRMDQMLAFIAKHPGGNMSCYVAGALACAGRVFERGDWTNAAMGESSGVRTLLTKCLYQDAKGKTDGLWHEGTMFYHFYSVCPLVTLREQARKLNAPIISDTELWGRFEEMFAAPVQLVDEKLRMPLIGDLGAPRVMNLAAYRHLYEYAAGRINPERFGPLLAEIYTRSGATRGGMAALAFGPDELPKPGGIPTSSTLLPAAKIGVFRSNSMQVLFRAGNYSAGHDHPDRLQINLSAFGQPVSPDLGTTGYSVLPIVHHYYRTTIAHNTVFADEKNVPGKAKLDWRGDQKDQCARGEMTAEGVNYCRTVFFAPPYVVLLDEYSSNEDHRFGWAYHAFGDVEVTGADLQPGSRETLGMPALKEDGHYSMLMERLSGTASNQIRAEWKVARGLRLHLTSVTSAPVEVTACKSIGNPMPDYLGCVILRCPGKSLRIATVLEPSRVAGTVESVALDAESVVVKSKGNITKTFKWS